MTWVSGRAETVRLSRTSEGVRSPSAITASTTPSDNTIWASVSTLTRSAFGPTPERLICGAADESSTATVASKVAGEVKTKTVPTVAPSDGSDQREHPNPAAAQSEKDRIGGADNDRTK